MKQCFACIVILTAASAYPADLYYIPAIGDRSIYRYRIEEDRVEAVAEIACNSGEIASIASDPAGHAPVILFDQRFVRLDLNAAAQRCTPCDGVMDFEYDAQIDPSGRFLYTPVVTEAKEPMCGALIDLHDGKSLAFLRGQPFTAFTVGFKTKDSEIFYSARGGIYCWNWSTQETHVFQPDETLHFGTGVTYLGWRDSALLVHTASFKTAKRTNGQLKATAGDGYTVIADGMDGIAVRGTPASDRFVVYDEADDVFTIYDFATKHTRRLNVRESMLAEYPNGPPAEVLKLLHSTRMTYHTADGRYLVVALGNTARVQSVFSVYDLDEARWSRVVPVGTADIGGVAGFVSWVPEGAEGTRAP